MNAPLRHYPVAVLKERPFDGRLHVLDVDWSRAPTIADVLAAQADVPQSFHDNCVCVVNDEIVPRPMWRYVRPKPCYVRDGAVIDVVVIFRLPLGGSGAAGGRSGGSGGAKKNPTAMVASIAVLLVGAAVSGGALAALAPGAAGFLGAGTIGAHLAGAAISLGGALAVAALTPPPSLRSNQGVIPADGGTNAAASLSGNVIGKGSPVPRVIGTMRVYPPIISPPLIEIVGDQTVAECVFGLAGPHALSDILVGTTTSATIVELETEIQEGLPNSPVLGLVTRQSFTDPTATQMMTQHVVDQTIANGGVHLYDQSNYSNSLPQWQGLTSRVAPDEIWIALSFSSGLSVTSNGLQFVPFRIRMRPAGTTSWINLPEFHVIRQSPSAFQVAVKLMWQATPPQNTLIADSGGPLRIFTTVPTQTVVSPTGAGGWTADGYFYNGTGDTYLNSSNIATTTGVINVNCYTDRIEFYLNNAVKFPKGGSWEIQVIRGETMPNSSFSPSNYEFTGTVYDLFGYYLSSGIAIVFQDQTQLADRVEIARLSSIWNVPPVPDPSQFAVIGAKVTDRSIDQLSVLASSYVRDWDGAGWNTLTTSSNPAPHYYDVLIGSLGGSPLPVIAVDSTGLVAFRSHCISMGYTCNAVVEGKTYMDVLTMIAACGYAKPAHAELWGVSMDQNTSASAPVQIFTPRNLQGFTVSKAFIRQPTGIRAQYADSTNNYLPNEIVVFADPNNPDSSRLEQIAYDGLDSLGGTNGVDTRAMFDLLQGQLRLTFYKGKADVESIVCQKGDLVGIQQDIFDGFAGAARVATVQRSGGNITGVTLDGTVPVNTGTDIAAWPDLATAPDMAMFGAEAGLCIRLTGGNGIVSNQITAAANGDENAVTFTTPFSDPGTWTDSAGNIHEMVDVGCLCTAGYLGTEYRRFKVAGITPSSDMTADMVFVDEAPGLWNPSTGAPL